MAYIVILIAAIIPFSYFELFSIRVAPAALVVVYSFLLTNLVYVQKFNFSLVYRYRYNLMASLVLLFFSMFSIVISQNPQFILSFVVFMLFMVWPFFVGRTFFSYEKFMSISRIYIYGAIFCAAGLFFQFFSFFMLGQEFFRVNTFGGGRTAFSFLWQDFSFLSLYLISAIPLTFMVLRKYLAILISIFLFLGSIITSARTGLGALVLFSVFYLLFYLARAAVLAKINKTSIILGLSAFSLFFLYVYFLSVFEVRALTISDSGRIKDHLMAINYWLDFPYFGSWMDPLRYSESVGFIPHHIVSYSLVMGGLFFVLIFSFWLASLYCVIFVQNFYLMSSILIALLGFNFIPSFFSAYFLAFLFSLSIFYREAQYRQGS